MWLLCYKGPSLLAYSVADITVHIGHKGDSLPANLYIPIYTVMSATVISATVMSATVMSATVMSATVMSATVIFKKPKHF
jgi:hypothetical protein